MPVQLNIRDTARDVSAYACTAESTPGGPSYAPGDGSDALQSITERRMKEASLSLALQPGLPAMVLGLKGTWLKVCRLQQLHRVSQA